MALDFQSWKKNRGNNASNNTVIQEPSSGGALRFDEWKKKRKPSIDTFNADLEQQKRLEAERKTPAVSRPVDMINEEKKPSFLKHLGATSTQTLYKGLENIGQGIAGFGRSIQKEIPEESKMFKIDDNLISKGASFVKKDIGKTVEAFGKEMARAMKSEGERLTDKEAIDPELQQPIVSEDGKFRWDLMANPKYATSQFVNGVYSFIPGVASAVVTGGGTFAVMGTMTLMEKGNAYDDYTQSIAKNKGIEIGDLTPEDIQQADELSTYYGALSGMLETAPLAGLVNKLGGKRVAQGILKRLVLEVPKDVLIQAMQEGTTEGLQQFTQNLIAKESGIDPERKLSEGVVESAYGGAITGGGLGILPAVATDRGAEVDQKTAQPEVGETQVAIKKAQQESFEGTKKQYEGVEIVKDGKLDQKLAEGRIQDMELKLKEIVGEEKATQYKEEMSGKEFKDFDDLTQKSEEIVQKVSKTDQKVEKIDQKDININIVEDKEKKELEKETAKKPTSKAVELLTSLGEQDNETSTKIAESLSDKQLADVMQVFDAVEQRASEEQKTNVNQHREFLQKVIDDREENKTFHKTKEVLDTDKTELLKLKAKTKKKTEKKVIQKKIDKVDDQRMSLKGLKSRDKMEEVVDKMSDDVVRRTLDNIDTSLDEIEGKARDIEIKKSNTLRDSFNKYTEKNKKVIIKSEGMELEVVEFSDGVWSIRTSANTNQSSYSGPFGGEYKSKAEAVKAGMRSLRNFVKRQGPKVKNLNKIKKVLEFESKKSVVDSVAKKDIKKKPETKQVSLVERSEEISKDKVDQPPIILKKFIPSEYAKPLKKFDGLKGLSTKIVEELKGKTIISKQFIMDLAKRPEIKQKERDLIMETLAEFENKVNVSIFAEKVNSRLLQLKTIVSDTYANYGMDNVDFDYDSSVNPPKTHIYDSPFEHGKTGHFSGDFERGYYSSVHEGVVRIYNKKEGRAIHSFKESGSLNTFEKEEKVDKWIEKNRPDLVIKKSGLFGHTRVWEGDEGVRYIAEIQSDVFQGGKEGSIFPGQIKSQITKKKAELEGYIKEKKRGQSTSAQSGSLDIIIKNTKGNISELENTLGKMEKNKEVQMFVGYKNTWHERMIREEIMKAADSKLEVLRFPTPRTISKIEGYIGDSAPYDIDGDPAVGKLIEYGEEDMIIVRVWGDNSFEAVAEEKVRQGNVDELASGETENNRSENEYVWGQIEEKKQKKIESGKSLEDVGEVDQLYLSEVIKKMQDEKTSFETANDSFFEDFEAKFDADDWLESVYGSEGYRIDDDTFFTSKDGDNIEGETFQSPDSYQAEDQGEASFNYEEDLEGSEQKTVARFYDKQVIKYLKKTRKDNLELVEDDQGNSWWETKITEEDLSPVMAYSLPQENVDTVLSRKDVEAEIAKMKKDLDPYLAKRMIVEISKEIVDLDGKRYGQLGQFNSFTGVMEFARKQELRTLREAVAHEPGHLAWGYLTDKEKARAKKYVGKKTLEEKREIFGKTKDGGWLYDRYVEHYKSDEMMLVEEVVVTEATKNYLDRKRSSKEISKFRALMEQFIELMNTLSSKIFGRRFYSAPQMMAQVYNSKSKFFEGRDYGIDKSLFLNRKFLDNKPLNDKLEEYKEMLKMTEGNEDALGFMDYELDQSEAGERIFLESEKGGSPDVISKGSTFSDWIPEEARNRKTIDGVLPLLKNIEEIKIPKNKSERALLFSAFAQLDERLEIDTSDIREEIKNKAETLYSENKASLVGKKGQVKIATLYKQVYSEIFDKEQPLSGSIDEDLSKGLITKSFSEGKKTAIKKAKTQAKIKEFKFKKKFAREKADIIRRFKKKELTRENLRKVLKQLTKELPIDMKRNILSQERVFAIKTGKKLGGVLDTIEKMKIIAIREQELRLKRQAVVAIIKAKDIRKTEQLRKALSMPRISKMTDDQITEFNEVLTKTAPKDTFLTQRQLETVKLTELEGIKTLSEARQKLAERTGKTLEEISNIESSSFDYFRYDTALAEKNPFYKIMVEDVNKAFLAREAEYIETEEIVNEMLKSARASRKRSVSDFLVPSDKKIFEYLESENKEALPSIMTMQEILASEFIKEQYEEMRDYLVENNVLNSVIKNYMVHIRRGFLETWKDDGFVQAFKEIFEQQKQDQAVFNILSDTGQILPLEKFFKFSMKRTGNLTPTNNVALGFLAYKKAFDRKVALDSVVPKLSIYVGALTPSDTTPKGLVFDRSLDRFFKTWLNNKRSRKHDLGGYLPQGGKADALLLGAKAVISIIDLGLNIPVGLASQVGEQVSDYVLLGNKNYVKSIKRLSTKKGRRVVGKYKNFVGRSPYSEILDPSTNIADKSVQLLFILFRDAQVRANKMFLLGSMTDEEFSSENISDKRLAELNVEMGRYRVVEGAKSVAGSTSVGSLSTQYRTWAVPILRTTADNLKNIKKNGLASKGNKELLRSTIATSVAGLIALSAINDDDDDFLSKIKNKMIRESLTLIGALNPKLFLGEFRIMSFVSDLLESLEMIIKLEKYKTTKKGYYRKGDLKGPRKLKKTVVPKVIRDLTVETGKNKYQNYNESNLA